MHAAIHSDFKSFLETEHSVELYQKVLDTTGYENKHFEAEVYQNDASTEKAIDTAAELLSQSRLEFLTDMGKFGAKGLFEFSQPMIDPAWKTLDLVEKVESHMHKYTREEMGAFPPALKAQRVSENELIINVLSHRKMAGLAKGFILGFADIYEESITVDVEVRDNGYTFNIKKTT